jgi:catechol 2,3-dioxygenase-like lactoylglutathione lyase family enzyme
MRRWGVLLPTSAPAAVWKHDCVAIDGLTPYAHVADVRRSIEFYRRLGLEVRSTHEPEGRLVWAYLAGPNDSPSRLMLALADEPVDAEQQAVLFYCWSPDVRALRAQLVRAGVDVGEIHCPFYMPAGEFRLADPDGYVVLVGQLGDPER